MPRSPLTETIKRAEGMVHYVQENLSEEEYMLFLDMVDPLPEPVQKPAKKKSSKKSADGGGGRSSKSPRATGMAAQLNKQLDGRRKEPEVGGFADDADMIRCTAMIDHNGGQMICDETQDDNIHHKQTLEGYHQFQPAEQAAVASGD